MQKFKLAVVVVIILAFLGLIISPVLAQVPLQDVKVIFLGDLSVGQFLGYLLMALVGAVIHLWLDVRDRDKSSPKTPYTWSWQFFTMDNIKRFVATILLIFVCLRFFSDIVGVDLTPFTALLWGFGLDRVAGFGKNHTTILKAKRDKLFPQ